MEYLLTWAFVLLAVITPAAVTALYIHLFCAGTFRRATRPWAEGAAFAGMFSVLAFAWGLWKSFAWDIGETCALHGHRYDFDFRLDPARRQQGLLPLFSNKCDASYDLVPGYVNPLFWSCVALTAVLTCCAVAVAVRGRRRDRVARGRESAQGA